METDQGRPVRRGQYERWGAVSLGDRRSPLRRYEPRVDRILERSGVAGGSDAVIEVDPVNAMIDFEEQ
jgi:hypothetical protein